MILPIGDTPNPQNFTPWVNWALIAANVVIYLFVSLPLSTTAPDLTDPEFLRYLTMLVDVAPGIPIEHLLAGVSQYDLVIFEHGYKPGSPEISDLLSSMFMHSGFAHLAGNMLFLWIYGDNVEHRLGRLGYLVVYLLAGIAATVSFAWLSGPSMTPLVGASGAISGVLGLYFLLFPANKVKLFVLFFPWVVDVFYVGARWVLGFYVIFENLLPLATGSASNVAYGAHLGGFFFGLGAAFVAQWWVMRPATEEDDRGRFYMNMARQRLEQGQAVSAYQYLQRAVKADPDLWPEARELMDSVEMDPRARNR